MMHAKKSTFHKRIKAISLGLSLTSLSLISHHAIAATTEQQTLFSAIKNQQTTHVTELLSANHDLNFTAPLSPLVAAIENNDLPMLDLLLKAGAFVDYANGQDTALIMAIRQQNQQMIQRLIAAGAQLDLKSDEYPFHTPLMVAAELGFVDIGKMLIELGANFDEIDALGDQVLAVAAYHNKVDFIDLVLDKGAKLNFYNFTYTTALDHAQRNQSTDAVAHLTKLGAKSGTEFAISPAQRNLYKAIRSKKQTGLEALLSEFATKQISLDFVNFNTPLELAISKDQSNPANQQLVYKLLAQGADVNFSGQNTTPLIAAIEATADRQKSPAHNNETQLVLHLINLGADVNLASRSADELSPLMVAAQQGRLTIAKLLLAKGAKPLQTSRNGNIALKFAIDSGNQAMISLLSSPEALTHRNQQGQTMAELLGNE